MAIEQTSAAVQSFFANVGFAGLKLPNGWFGRPHDNLHELTRADVIDDALVIELDGHLVLTFVGPSTASNAGEVLQLTGFRHLSWDWREYGSETVHHEEFEGGMVEFIAQPA